MRFSGRVDLFDPNPISADVAVVRSAGRSLVSLSDSNPTRHGLAPALLPSVYDPDPRGPIGARRALAEFFSASQEREVRAEDLYLLSSTSQAYSWAMKLFCDPGDAVCSPAPGYPLVEQIARLEGVVQVPYPLEHYGRWEIDTAEIERLVEESASPIRAIIAIVPNNPTGSYVEPRERAELLRICRSHDLPLIADEVFFDYGLDGRAGRERLAGCADVLVLALDGLSKRLAAPHAKLAWIEVSGPADLVAEAKARLDVIADAFLPIGTPVAERVPEFLAGIPAASKAVRARCLENLSTLRRIVASEPSGAITLLAPEGGWSALVRFPSAIDEDELVLALIDEDGVFVHPGYFFDMPNPGYASVSLLLEPEVFRAAASALVDRLGRAVAGAV